MTLFYPKSANWDLGLVRLFKITFWHHSVCARLILIYETIPKMYIKKWPSLHREGGEESKEIKVLHITLDFACVHDLMLGRTFLINFYPKNASLSLFWGCRQSFWAFTPLESLKNLYVCTRIDVYINTNSKMYKSMGLMCLPQMTLIYPKSTNWDLGFVMFVYRSI